MPLSLTNTIFPQAATRIIRYGQDVLARVVATRAYASVRPIVTGAGTEILVQVHAFSVEWATR
jgi:hypothetical protein